MVVVNRNCSGCLMHKNITIQQSVLPPSLMFRDQQISKSNLLHVVNNQCSPFSFENSVSSNLVCFHVDVVVQNLIYQLVLQFTLHKSLQLMVWASKEAYNMHMSIDVIDHTIKQIYNCNPTHIIFYTCINFISNVITHI